MGGGTLCQLVWGFAHPGLVRQDEPAPTQPGRRSDRQQRCLENYHCEAGHQAQTQNYMVRRTLEGRSKREIIRCLKRYVAREVYRALLEPAAVAMAAGWR
jgi:hypothetical protein